MATRKAKPAPAQKHPKLKVKSLTPRTSSMVRGGKRSNVKDAHDKYA